MKELERIKDWVRRNRVRKRQTTNARNKVLREKWKAIVMAEAEPEERCIVCLSKDIDWHMRFIGNDGEPRNYPYCKACREGKKAKS